MAKGSLDLYKQKRDFAQTPEPPPEVGKGPGGRFVVHEHHASRLHYDLRIEMGGVLKSFAVPKGPTLDPKTRRLAVETEEHPVKYLEFQGSIDDGNYGAGQMVIWDRGTYSVPTGETPMEAYRKGKLHLEFRGERLRGVFMLIRGAHGERQWLLFKKKDADAKPGWEPPRILPYGSRAEKPAGFEIPGAALRDVKDWTPVDNLHGLRPDKDPKNCVRENPRASGEMVEEAEVKSEKPRGKSAAASRPAAKSGPKNARAKAIGVPAKWDQPAAAPEAIARITHPYKVYWPADDYTKADLIAYYEAVSRWLLPHLKDRPLILKRFPNGIGKPAFYQHDVQSSPAFVTRAPLQDEDGSLVHYAVCQNLESLVWLANIGVIPQNPWLSRVPNPDRPDYAVFDLDPQDSVPFPEVCSLALFVKEVLDGLGLKAWAKTSGSRGIHIYVPLKPRYDFGQSLAFSEMIGAYVAGLKPDAFTVERSIKGRPQGRIYLDCMQNSRGKSVASVYSAREKPGAPVSTPLEWPELKKSFAMADFNIQSLPKRLQRKGDLFADVLKGANAIEGAKKKLAKAL
jgi:bifunctional non-homologous end joining protein LigD